MIGKLTGRIDSTTQDHALLDVAGVGYVVFASAKNARRAAQFRWAGLIALIETHVREDHIHLVRFLPTKPSAAGSAH